MKAKALESGSFIDDGEATLLDLKSREKEISGQDVEEESKPKQDDR